MGYGGSDFEYIEAYDLHSTIDSRAVGSSKKQGGGDTLSSEKQGGKTL